MSAILQTGAHPGLNETANLRPVAHNASRGRVYLWQGGSLWIGEARGRTEWHQHHAHQLALAPQGGMRFRSGAAGRWTDFDGAVVPSHGDHQFEADGKPVIHLFVEPESRAGRALAARHGRGAVVALEPALAKSVARSLFESFHARPDREAMLPAAEAAVARLCGAGTEADAALDSRLGRALDYIRAHIRHPLALADVAGHVALSESRFRHLFMAQTGSSFRAYLLWLRINLAIEAVMAGASWTAAAHEAGFADSAHLARTHKRMFGIEPTSLRPQLPSTNGFERS